MEIFITRIRNYMLIGQAKHALSLTSKISLKKKILYTFQVFSAQVKGRYAECTLEQKENSSSVYE